MGNLCASDERKNVTVSEAETRLPLTKKEKHLLKESWQYVKPKWKVIVADAYDKWFVQYPELRPLFTKTVNDVSVPEVLLSATLQVHVMKLQEFSERIVFGLHEEQTAVVRSLIDYGVLHDSYGATHKYTNALVANLKQSICQQLRETEMSLPLVQTQNAWDSLIKFMGDMLKLGMRKGKELQKERTDVSCKQQDEDLMVAE